MAFKKRFQVPFNLQFFAEGDGEGDGTGEGNDTPQGNDGDGNTNEDKGNNGQKTFTQEDVNRMMAKEKREGKKSVLSSLGFKTEDEAKNAMKLLNALLDSQKSPEDKANDKAKTAEDEKEQANRRADMAENKLSCLMAGVSKDSIDDVLAIALLKVSDEKNLDKVLEEMKKEKRYSSFFGEGDDGSGSGTGNEPGHNAGGKGGKGKEPGAFGKMVAEMNAPAKKKSSFFEEV